MIEDLLEGAELLALAPDDVLIVRLPNGHRWGAEVIHEIADRLRHALPDRKVLVFADLLSIRIEKTES